MKVLTFIGVKGKQLSVDARLSRRDTKKDIESVREELSAFCVAIDAHFVAIDARFNEVNQKLGDLASRLSLIEYKQNFMQAFALQAAVKTMKVLDGSGKEDLKVFIKDGEELMKCMERGGEGCGENEI
ncbi:unnamed protein product [Tuber aestivum]|uniref:Uncharacterized protein n=1 Tax=Tuber aestivum TaxID=59557 RepID=A0A292PMC3_9PEZI|nr:unnamed protein product [Tuber aestivum]